MLCKDAITRGMFFVSKVTIKKENKNLRKSHNSTSSSSQNPEAKQNFDPKKVLIVSAYVGLWIVHYMLVHASAHPRYEDASSRKLDPTFVILLTEFIKLIMSAVIYIAQRRVSNLCDNVTNTDSFRIGPMTTLFAQYLPIAFLYAVSNNLMIINLQYFDPTAYVILQSSKLIMTATVMWIVIGRSINRMKQISILIITAGVCMKEPPTSKSSGADNQSGGDSGIDTMSHYFHLGLIFLQMLCGVLASLYNESLLKKRKKEIDINVANMSLYIESILLNGFAMWMIPQGSLGHSSFNANIDMVCSSVLHQGIILTLAMVGIVSSLMLRYVDTLSKAVVSSTIILFTTILGRIFFGLEISGQVIISAVFVSIGVHSYTFSNEENTTLTLKLIKRSLFKTFRQLWFIPVFFYLISMYDLVQTISSNYDLENDSSSMKLQFDGINPEEKNTSSLISSLNGTNPETILQYGKVVSIENLENQHWLDDNLHQLNGGQKLTASKWQQYVRLHLSNALVKALLEANGCRVLDVGCGGGAFSRSLLKLHDKVEILGVDHEKLMIEVSHISLQNKTSNFKAAVASMEDASGMHEAIVDSGIKGSFHIAFLIDSLCYLPNNEAVQQSIANALYPLYPGGLLVASMIPETLEAIQSCKIVISRDLIDRMKTVVGYEILDLNINRSDNWENGNQTGRYSFILKKTGQTTVDSMVLDKGVKFSHPFLNSTELDWTIPEGVIVPKVKIRRYQEAQNVIHYITKKLEEKGAPLILKYGTVLHEFRAGVEGQFVPNIKDKDLDIGVFSRHFHFIRDMLPKIEELFGWKPDAHLVRVRKKLIIVLLPYDLTEHGSLDGFQIDIYGFHCDLEKNIAWWPWDRQRFRLDATLPLKAHTRIANRIMSDTNGWVGRQNLNSTEISNHILYIPSDTACYLENLYGHDFRDPMDTKFYRQNAYDDPVCNTPTHDATEKLEFMRQIMFCQHCESSEMNQNVIANYSSGLQVTSKLCTNE